MPPTPKSIHKNYYEAIIQLRPEKKEVLDFIMKQIEKNNIYVSKTVQFKTGLDIYVSSQKFAQQLLRKLKKSFKGKGSSTRSLFTQHRLTSKKVYRVTILFKPE